MHSLRKVGDGRAESKPGLVAKSRRRSEGLDAEALQPPGEEALAPRPSRRLLLLLGQRQESARAQVFDAPDEVAVVDDFAPETLSPG